MVTDDYAVELLNDVRNTFPHWFGENEQFWRRTAVRATFGTIEGWCSYVRSDSPDTVERWKTAGLLTPEDALKAAELLIATDRHEIVLDDKRLPKKQKRKMSLRPMFRATVRLYCLGKRPCQNRYSA
jgi:hypothetical protein